MRRAIYRLNAKGNWTTRLHICSALALRILILGYKHQLQTLDTNCPTNCPTFKPPATTIAKVLGGFKSGLEGFSMP